MLIKRYGPMNYYSLFGRLEILSLFESSYLKNCQSCLLLNNQINISNRDRHHTIEFKK